MRRLEEIFTHDDSKEPMLYRLKHRGVKPLSKRKTGDIVLAVVIGQDRDCYKVCAIKESTKGHATVMTDWEKPTGLLSRHFRLFKSDFDIESINVCPQEILKEIGYEY